MAENGDSGEGVNVHRLKTLAEEKYASGDLNSAVNFAERAHSQRPNLDGLSEMLTAFHILRSATRPVTLSDGVSGAPDYYKILQVERFSSISGIKKQYRKLALTLHPDKKPFAACEDAFKVVADAFRVLSDKIRRKEYDLKLTIAMQSETGEEAAAALETFRTVCSNCRLFHTFDRKYVGHNLMCPKCKKSFKAVEASENSSDSTGIGSEDEQNDEISGTRVSARLKARKMSSVGEILLRAKKRSFGDVEGSSKRLVELRNVRVEGESSRSKSLEDSEEEEETMTLAEMQMLAVKKMNKKKKSRKRKGIQVCSSENESEIDGESIVTKNVKVKEGKRFKKGQVWAVYSEKDDNDGMPQRYALIHEVVSSNPFKLRLCWLEFQNNVKNTGPRMSCGRYKVSEQTSAMSVNMFSHIVDCDRVAREVYMVYPKKGSVWAMYAENSANQGVEDRQYDIVVCLTSYTEVHGLSLGYLEKVDGFRTLFKRKEVGVVAVRWIGKDEIGLMSHQIAARKVSGEEAVAIGKDCWELDDPIFSSS